MGKGLRIILAGIVALVLAGQTAASAHAHADDAAMTCDICVLADRADEAAPLPVGPALAAPLTASVLKAFAARTAIVPSVTAHPPGRAPPLTL